MSNGSAVYTFADSLVLQLGLAVASYVPERISLVASCLGYSFGYTPTPGSTQALPASPVRTDGRPRTLARMRSSDNGRENVNWSALFAEAPPVPCALAGLAETSNVEWRPKSGMMKLRDQLIRGRSRGGAP
jgi:hypothetical protein